MIRKVEDFKEIVPLWQEAFGDTSDDILYFAKNVKNAECVGYYVDDNLASMLYLVYCRINNTDSKYIYAACTLNKFKSNGYMSALIDYCKQNSESICLIPANEGLIDFYKSRGFDSTCDVSCLNFYQIKDVNDYLFEGCALDKPILMVYRR